MKSRLALSGRNCVNGMRDPPHSRTCRLSLVHHVRTSQLKGAPLSASVPAGAGAYRRTQLAAISSALVWKCKQHRQKLLRANRQYLRPRTRSLEMGFGRGRKLLPSCTRTGTSASGTISATAYPRSLPIRSSPLHSRKSPHQIRLALSQQSRAHRVCHHHGSGHCQLLTDARSPKNLLFVGQNVRGLSVDPTLIPVLDALHAVWILCSPAAFRLRNQQQQSSCVGASQNPGKWTLWSGAGVHGACSFRPLSGRSNAASSSRPLQSFPIPARQRPLVGLGRQLRNTNYRRRSQ